MSFAGVAVVTGAGSDDGRAVAHQLVKSGCRRLALAGSSQADLANVEAECHALQKSDLEILAVECDTNSPDSIDNFVTCVISKFGEINYCANCERPKASELNTLDMTTSIGRSPAMKWQRSTWLLMRAEIRQFLVQRRSGKTNTSSIVNIAAAQGLASEGGFPDYCAAAHGIVGMTKPTALDYLADGIRVNCVCPGSSGPLLGEDEDINGTQSKSLPQPPNGRYITSEEIAEAVQFLLKDSSISITGISLPVDGGWSLKHH